MEQSSEGCEWRLQGCSTNHCSSAHSPAPQRFQGKVPTRYNFWRNWKGASERGFFFLVILVERCSHKFCIKDKRWKSSSLVDPGKEPSWRNKRVHNTLLNFLTPLKFREVLSNKWKRSQREHVCLKANKSEMQISEIIMRHRMWEKYWENWKLYYFYNIFEDIHTSLLVHRIQ